MKLKILRKLEKYYMRFCQKSPNAEKWKKLKKQLTQ